MPKRSLRQPPTTIESDIKPDREGDRPLRRLQFFIYLLPVLGAFPASWTLYRDSGDREQRRVSRLSVMMSMVWLLGAAGLSVSSQQSESLFLPALLVGSLWSSGYFLISLGLMIRLWQNQPLLPSPRRKIN